MAGTSSSPAPPGGGKTFLACALGNAACRQGFTTRYFRVPRLLGDLELARADGSYAVVLGRLATADLLILDDWGLAPLTAAEARDLLEVIDDRSMTRSTLVSSQLPVENWHSTMADPTVADAILDRLVHSAYRIALKGESMRTLRKASSRAGVDTGRLDPERLASLRRNQWPGSAGTSGQIGRNTQLVPPNQSGSGGQVHDVTAGWGELLPPGYEGTPSPRTEPSPGILPKGESPWPNA